MRCFYILVHGKLAWRDDAPQPEADLLDRPNGFFCHRYVLASDQEAAREAALMRVEDNFEKQTGWIGSGLAEVVLAAEEVALAPMHKLLKPDNRGHTFYVKD